MKKKQANIKTNTRAFFRHWLTFTKPFHKLAPKEMDTIAVLLYYYHLYKKDINNPKIINKLLFDYDTKMLIKKDLGGMKDHALQNMLTGLRKKKVIISNELNPVYIPDFDIDSKGFQLIFNFIINAEKDNKEN